MGQISKPFGIIYAILNTITGEQYIGQTVGSLKKRWKHHRRRARIGATEILCHVICKYGKEAFILRIIDEASSREELNTKEVRWILELNTFVPGGYNMTLGGGGASGYRRVKKQSCRRGHPFNEVNTYIRPSDNMRVCLTCHYISKGLNLPDKLKPYAILTTPLPIHKQIVRKQQCKHGHQLDEINTYVNPSSGRCACWTCWYINHGKNLPNRLKRYEER
jgi:hypothetical protein